MLSNAEAGSFEQWIVAAKSCGNASQGFVGASSELAMVSRDLADDLDDNGSVLLAHEGGRDSLALALRQLATAVEEQSRELRDGYPLTEATLEQLRSIAGLDAEEER
jgi:hypothetical protein